jgi:hypothetical protein
MRIDLDKLEAMGVKFQHNEKENALMFFSERHNDVLEKQVRKVANLAEFSDAESDELHGTVYRMQMIGRLKRASGG